MNIFIDNSLVSFKILLSEDIDLQGEWRVALSGRELDLKVVKDRISRPYHREINEITKG